MEHVHKQTISFRGDRTMRNKEVSVGYEGDNLVERLEFVLPELVGGQTANLMITGADAITLNRTDDGRYAADLTREMIGPDGRRDAYVRIDGVSGQIWQSAPLRIVTGKLPDVEEEIEKVYPTAVGQMLTAMAEHTGEMEAQGERVERAAQRAEEAAERAESGGGSGGPGEDGGYYQPSVTDGVLTWTPSKADMPGVPASDVRGPAGQDGQPGKDGADGAPGKSAYQYAQDGGYTGTEAEFAEKMAEEVDLSGYYTKQETDAAIEEATNEGKYGLIETINISEDTASIERTAEPNGTPYNYKSILLKILFMNDTHSYNKYTLMEAFFGETSLRVFRINEGTPTGEQVIRTYREYGYVRGEISGVTTNINNISGGFSVYSSNAYLLTENNITRITLTKEEGFMNGDVIEIWGVRA